MLSKSFTYNNTYIISIIDNISLIERELQPYSHFDDYRSVFNSKEWILAYCKIYTPKEIIFVKATKTNIYFLLEIKDQEVHILGDPFNDYNLLFIPPNDFMGILYLLKSKTNKSIKINCLASPLPVRLQNYRKDIGLKWHELEETICISPKLQKMYNRDKSKMLFFRVTPSDELFQSILSKLLLWRIDVLKTKNNEGNEDSINERFSRFITTLCLNESIKDNIFIDYGICGDEIVSIGFNFIHHKNILYYLRWCSHSSNRHSYGLLHDIMSMNLSLNMGYDNIDFARGNEAYKYRLGLVEYNLYNYEI